MTDRDYSSSSSTTLWKDLYIIRHGQATHNPRAEAAKDAGCTFDEFLELMRQDDSFDSELTELGRQQAQQVYERYGPYFHQLQEKQQQQLDANGKREQQGAEWLVVSSPLSRALHTADLAVPPPPLDDEEDQTTVRGVAGRRLCVEEFREINGWLENARRRSVAELRDRFPRHWDFTTAMATDQDTLWTPTLESNYDCQQRAHKGLQWVMNRPEQFIVLVAHGGLLKQLMSYQPYVVVRDERRSSHRNDTNNATSRSSDARFGNAEMRRYRMEWGAESLGNNDPSCPSSASVRALVLSEMDIE